ncbi:MAG: DEAD/DEAH box helicase [Burkholderiales bacterium]|nr:DEAD/DEAH box helicase [Burkholderiales bacterium]
MLPPIKDIILDQRQKAGDPGGLPLKVKSKMSANDGIRADGSTYFSSILSELSVRAARATVSRLGFSNPPLRRHLIDLFSRTYGEPGSFLGDPVFEATFGWEPHDESMEKLSPAMLHPDLVSAMDAPPGGHTSEYRFSRETHPYSHQVAAWKHLLDPTPNSVLITSGTGSGKTECFMVPILNQLATEREAAGKLVGVRALFLYPLNALIQSQRERLKAWTSGFGAGVRFCLYNGNTPDKSRADRQRQSPNEVLDREVLRASPPPILVTNPTMLEYMLVRAQDAPILEQSQGALQWVVLDEAHNYIGSQAAELALLLRRVLHAFGVRSDQVRFIATSATIRGDKETTTKQLQEYLARLAGVPSERVHVIEGRRQIPPLNNSTSIQTTNLGELEAIDDAEALYSRLEITAVARGMRELFIPSSDGESCQPLSSIEAFLERSAVIGNTGEQAGSRWLDLLTRAHRGTGRARIEFLPLRMHVFHNTLNGLWACADPECPGRRDSALSDDTWHFGMIFTEERRHCECGAPVFPLCSCNDCNSTFLRADQLISGGAARLIAPRDQDVDEFTLDVEETEEADSPEDAPDEIVQSRVSPLLIVNGVSANGAKVAVDRLTCEIDPRDAAGTLDLRVRDLTSVDGSLRLVCPCCDSSGYEPDLHFRRAILGAPFLLGEIVPTLLEFCPDGEAPLERPMRGRRMITFTDSRQGTARIAAKLQQDSERNTVRTAVYQRVVRGGSNAGIGSDELRQRIVELRAAEAALKGQAVGAIITRQIEEAERELADQAKPPAFSFQDMTKWLATLSQDVGTWIHSYYADLDGEFRGNLGKERIAEILLMREFARRPKRVNSLETLGLVAVQYPKLENVRTKPAAVEYTDLTLEEWRAFLKLTLDFHVRENTFVLLPDSWRKWGGNRIAAKQLLPPTSQEKATSRLKKWPQCLPGARQGRLVRLLSCVLKLDPRNSYGRDVLDGLLRAAWDDLTNRAGLLQQGQLGRYLSLDDLAFSPLRRGWICPVTRRILDTTFRGVTPYLPVEKGGEETFRCRAIELPACELLGRDFPSEQARTHAVREWIDAQPAIASARAEGVWSDLSDRIVEGSRYFRAVEHSAQQSGKRLSDYEEQFRSGRINLMSCSTTMEMGVDIGGINMVAMNNVPPHPANYLQRAGRAGRRGESRSVALTVCKNNPHDQQVFVNTLWPFVSALPTPNVSLSSPLIVQRHINALLLSSFLRRLDKEGDLNKLSMEWWMLPRGGSRQEKFCAWCECFEQKDEAHVVAGLRSIVKHTAFDGRSSFSGLVTAVAAAAIRHADAWLNEFQAIEQQMGDFVGGSRELEKEPAFRALRIQRARLTGEYLLRELATSGFLPGYGFPTDITSFETLNRDALEAARQIGISGPKGRVDNRYERRDLPSRDTVTALREYAPGATVVLDGLVYESAGITLNWHVPATVQDIAEIQNIRRAWRCRGCGASGTTVQASRLDHCPECGQALHDSALLTYLEPAGFAVDIYESAHNDVSLQTYVPVESPWINGDGEWMPLSNPLLGRFRCTATGSVFHFSSGVNGAGYGVCLDCGRAAPIGSALDGDDTPLIFRRPHKRLRGKQGGEDSECNGSHNPFAIKKGLRFGREYTTDVLEIVLYSQSGRPLTDQTAAFTIAAALRRQIAALLGVEFSELGCDTKQIRTGNGDLIRAIQIFDVRSAGYCSSVGPHIVELLKGARQSLLCPQECDSACQHCLLTFDVRFKIDSLDRQRALDFLTAEWTNALRLPAAEAHFGTNSTAEHQPLTEAITREMNRPETTGLVVYLSGGPEEWDMPICPVTNLLHRLSIVSDKAISIHINAGSLNSVPAESMSVLRGLRDLGRVAISLGEPPTLQTGAPVLASVVSRDGTCRSWATSDPLAGYPGPLWGTTSASLLVIGATAIPVAGPPATIDTPDSMHVAAKGALRIEVSNELDGAADGFGRRLLALVREHLPGGLHPEAGTVTSLQYEDRYLKAPVAAGLFIDFVAALKQYFESEDRWSPRDVAVVTCDVNVIPGRSFAPSIHVSNDWTSAHARNEALLAALAYCGIDARISVLDRRDTTHSRVLTLGFANDRWLKIWLDQGFSYWSAAKVAGRNPLVFPFNESVSIQGEALARPGMKVMGHERPTQLFISIR